LFFDSWLELFLLAIIYKIVSSGYLIVFHAEIYLAFFVSFYNITMTSISAFSFTFWNDVFEFGHRPSVYVVGHCDGSGKYSVYLNVAGTRCSVLLHCSRAV